MKYLIFSIIIILFFTGCSDSPKVREQTSNRYARGFEINEEEDIIRLTVYNPWEKATNIKVSYILVDKEAKVPDKYINENIIRTPVEKVVCMSTTHLAFLDVLNETGSVAGISGASYVTNEGLRKRIESGSLPDVGYGQNINYELIVSLNPTLVLVYGVGSEVTGYTRKLEELGIPVVMVAEYLEESPLGKTEWIKFIGALYQKKDSADLFFNKVEKEYTGLKNRVSGKEDKPKVLVGSPYKDSWWVPGANSYMANLISDAGGDYLGKDHKSHESYTISFEHALAWAGEADIWINMGNLTSRQEIMAADQRFENFRVLNKGRVFNNIKRLSAHGGNDFWESGTVYPNLVLRDLINVFYPDLLSEDLVYYQELK